MSAQTAAEFRAWLDVRIAGDLLRAREVHEKINRTAIRHIWAHIEKIKAAGIDNESELVRDWELRVTELAAQHAKFCDKVHLAREKVRSGAGSDPGPGISPETP